MARLHDRPLRHTNGSVTSSVAPTSSSVERPEPDAESGGGRDHVDGDAQSLPPRLFGAGPVPPCPVVVGGSTRAHRSSELTRWPVAVSSSTMRFLFASTTAQYPTASNSAFSGVSPVPSVAQDLQLDHAQANLPSSDRIESISDLDATNAASSEKVEKDTARPDPTSATNRHSNRPGNDAIRSFTDSPNSASSSTRSTSNDAVTVNRRVQALVATLRSNASNPRPTVVDGM